MTTEHGGSVDRRDPAPAAADSAVATATSIAILRTEHASSDPSEVEELLQDAYGAQLRVGSGNGGPWQVSLTQTQAGSVTVADLDMSPDLGFQMAGQGDYVFSSMVSGSATCERDGYDPARYAGGDLLLAVDPEENSRYRTRQSHTRTVTLPAALMDDVARQGGTGRPGDWRFTERRAIPGGARRWNQTLAVLNGILAGPQTNATALVLGPAARLLAATALSIIPNTLIRQTPRGDSLDGHPDTLRRAIAFIEANPGLDMTLTDVARAAYVTPRAVQLAFRRHLHTTPMAYLRRVRLDHAHEQLQGATPTDGETVTRVAMDWGFSNSGQFAAYYRSAYGQPPSQTLRS